MACLILHVAETLRGGTASYIEEILPAQRQAIGDAQMALLIPAEQAAELPSAAGLTIFTFADRGGRLGHVVCIILALRKLFAELNPDIVHAQGTFAGVAVRLAALLWRPRAKIVYCAHGWAFDREGSGWKRAVIARIEAWLAPLADAIVCISRHDYDAAVAAGLPLRRLIAIPNAIARAVPIAAEPEWPDGCRRFVFVGRLDRQKGADVFLAAMQQLGEGAFAYLVGGAVISKEPSALILPANTAATGWLPRERAQAYLASADVVVVPSRWEGFGLTALEAMRAGKPVIASRVGGLPELVVDGVTGCLIEPNSVAALVAALRAAIDNDWTARGAAGYERFIQLYTGDRLNADLLQLYQTLLTRPLQIHLPQASQPCQ